MELHRRAGGQVIREQWVNLTGESKHDMGDSSEEARTNGV